MPDVSGTMMNAADAILGEGIAKAGREGAALFFGGQSLTYGDLANLVNRFGNALKAAGVMPGDRVLFLLKDTPDFVAAYLATLKIGGVAIAFNIRASSKDLAFAIEDSQCKVLFIDAEFVGAYRPIRKSLTQEPLAVVASAASGEYKTIENFVEGQPETLSSELLPPDAMAFWIYTSGTTGRPKATVHLQSHVLIGHRHLVENLGVKPGDKIFITSKIFFAYSLGHGLIGGLRAGAALVLFDGWPDADSVARVVERFEPDYLFSVPTFYRNLLQGGQAEGAAFKAVRHYVSAGEALPPSLWKQWHDVTGGEILEGIGASEATFLFIASRPDAIKPGACGQLLPWAEARLVADDGSEIDEPDREGILWVRMESNMSEYWGRPDKTAESLQDGWYCTDDMFSRDGEGYWTHHGRGDDMLKISGQWVSPVEIEDVALTVPGVSEAAVVGAPNADGLVRLALFLVADTGEAEQDKLTEQVQTAIKERLSIYKCPRMVHYVETLPRTPTGKLQRFQLRKMAEDTTTA